VGSVQLLDRRLMTSHEAARQLGIPATTLIRWLEGEQRRGTWYPPVLREDPTGQTDVTWGEVVEASGRRLMLEVQEDRHLPETLRAVYEVNTGQLILDPRAAGFLERVEFADGGDQEALRIRPAGKDSPVVIDPLDAGRVGQGGSVLRVVS
jgi:hypothetical protein